MSSKTPWKYRPIGIEYAGGKITLPNDPKEMTLAEAREALERLEREAEQAVTIYEPIDCFPLEGAYATMKVLKRKFGWAEALPTPGFFGPKPPTLVGLQVGYRQSVQVVWGRFGLPGLEGYLQCGVAEHESDGHDVFILQGEVRRKFQPTIQEIAEEIRAEVLRESIYQGKAIQLILDDERKVNWNKPPVFINTKTARPDELVFSDEIAAQVAASLFNPIRHTDRCRAFKIPLKRGVLLAGPYGTGKTLTANVVAQLCEQNGWTYIHLKDATALEAALTFARRYQPAVVFAEDIDRAMTGERDSEIDAILNTIDGVDSKSAEIITILTTNHPENIAQAMLRPGRLDAVINVKAPDAKAVERLIRLYGRKLIPADESLSRLGAVLSGNIPAVIREVVERAKLYAIADCNDGTLQLSEQALIDSANGMIEHLRLLNRTTSEPSANEKLGQAFGAVIEASMSDGVASRIAREVTDRM